MGVLAGTTTSHRELEEMVARFLGKEECIAFNMGYGTNATTIPALCSAVSPYPRSSPEAFLLTCLHSITRRHNMAVYRRCLLGGI